MLATIRVMPKNKSEKEEDRAMEYEYKDEVVFIKYLDKDKRISDYSLVGNAISIDCTGRKPAKEFQAFVQKHVPKEKIGIELGYWVED